MQTVLVNNIYEFGHLFPVVIALTSIVLLLANEAHLTHYSHFRYYLISLSAFFVASTLYATSMIYDLHLIHPIASLLETGSIVAIILAIRSDHLRDERDV